jgi:hypothetical protein
MRLKLSAVALCCLTLFACKEKQKSSSAEEKQPIVVEQQVDTTISYFSLKQYFADQWKTRSGNPYTLLRVNTVNGKTDSAYLPMDEALWRSIVAPFEAADISNKKFLGYYKFDSFEDDATQTTHFYYEATSPKLFTRKMDISADIVSNLVRTVYVETQNIQEGRQIFRKLQYVPDKLVQIQEFEKVEGQPEKTSRLVYKFTY